MNHTLRNIAIVISVIFLLPASLIFFFEKKQANMIATQTDSERAAIALQDSIRKTKLSDEAKMQELMPSVFTSDFIKSCFTVNGAVDCVVQMNRSQKKSDHNTVLIIFCFFLAGVLLVALIAFSVLSQFNPKRMFDDTLAIILNRPWASSRVAFTGHVNNGMPDPNIARMRTTIDELSATVEQVRRQNQIIKQEASAAPEPGQVYLLRRQGGAIKIGFTSRFVDVRKVEIEGEGHGPLEVVSVTHSSVAHAAEKVLHGVFASKNVGGEFFKLNDADIQIVSAIVALVEPETIIGLVEAQSTSKEQTQ